MAHNWTSRVARRATAFGRVFRPRDGYGIADNDADARRMRIEIDAIRARFPDHA
jgi:hypothetical protein